MIHEILPLPLFRTNPLLTGPYHTPPDLSTMGYLFSDWCLVLAYYGVESKAKDLLESYLSNRKQFVQIWGIVSKIKPITIGVPQGSVIGPLLLNILSMI